MNDVHVPAATPVDGPAPSRRRRRAAITAALVIGSFGASVAVAQWTSTATGPGEARSLSAVALTVTARTATADLYPGFTNGDLYFSVTNPNPYPVTLTSAALGTVTSLDTTNCPSANVTTDATATGLSLAVAAGATTDFTLADVVNMIAGAPDGCQSKDFRVALTLTGSQV